MNKCPWCLTTKTYEKYHDETWGTVVTERNQLFEALCLELFQSGLSWLTILNKRNGFRAAFHDFNIDRVAQMSEDDVALLLNNDQIVRHRQKIQACINNAKCILKMEQEQDWAQWIWSYTHYQSIQRDPHAEPIAQNERSKQLAKDLKQKGFKFLGPTTVYSFMQSVGMHFDHDVDCFRYLQWKDVKKDPKLREWSKS